MGTKKALKGQEEEDRLSSLQDELLCRILSRLPTKEAFATSALSTRWRNVYASITDLEFNDYRKGATITTNDFIAYVTNVISAVRTKSKNIRQLELNCSNGTYTGSLVASWIAAVSGPDLQELDIYTSTLIDPVPLPPQFFHCRALTSMRLKGPFSLCLPECILFPSLKILDLEEMILPDEMSFRRFLSGCIVLEALDLVNCVIDSISVFEVSLASLDRLYMEHRGGDYMFLLNAPNLESFYFKGYAARGYFGDTLNSLVSADVEVYLEDGNFAYERVSQLISMVINATSLRLGGDSMETLINQKTVFHKLTKLSLQPDCASGWLSLANLLNNAPRLECIEFIHGLRGYSDNEYADEECYMPENVPVCVSTHLKEVIFQKYSGEEIELKVVEYFLKNAEVLEKMSVSPDPVWNSDLGGFVFPDSEDRVEMSKRLLELPRWSSDCQIVFGS